MSSLPKALVATQVKRAESARSSLLMLRSESTPVGRLSPRMVYLLVRKFQKPVVSFESGRREMGSNLPRIAFGIESFAVHVPEDTDWFFAFGFALENVGLTTTGRLVFEFDFELRRC